MRNSPETPYNSQKPISEAEQFRQEAWDIFPSKLAKLLDGKDKQPPLPPMPGSFDALKQRVDQNYID